MVEVYHFGQDQPWFCMGGVGDDGFAHKTVYQCWKCVLNRRSRQKMPSSANSMFRCVNGVKCIWTHDTVDSNKYLFVKGKSQIANLQLWTRLQENSLNIQLVLIILIQERRSHVINIWTDAVFWPCNDPPLRSTYNVHECPVPITINMPKMKCVLRSC